MDIDSLTNVIIGTGILVHKTLGPGLLESAYEACLLYELRERGLHVDNQKLLPIEYKGVQLDCGYRLDLVVNDLVLVELKSVAKIDPIHEAQIQTYLKLSKYTVGLLFNFNVRLLRDGIRRFVNGYVAPPSRASRLRVENTLPHT
jgi:GxxExxY protein